RPELVILDEPFSGLDPVNMDVVRDAVLELQRGGATVIFSTHDMGVAERMCDFIFMIYKGNKVLDGTLDSIQNEYGADTLRVSLSGNRGAEAYAGLPGVEEVRDLGNYQEVRLVKNADSQPILHALLSRGRVERFEVARPSLHDIFVRIARPEVDAEESEPALHA
ncbi:MAG TPA: DUF4162 domain-containing protein, partial [Planctomycetia bacterium]|nr:DUF4162 domain-containing protein [Planctomycetia bacterium]